MKRKVPQVFSDAGSIRLKAKVQNLLRRKKDFYIKEGYADEKFVSRNFESFAEFQNGLDKLEKRLNLVHIKDGRDKLSIYIFKR